MSDPFIIISSPKSIEEALTSILSKILPPLIQQELQKKVDESLLTRKQAAVLLSVDPATISNWISNGWINNYGKGRMVFVKESELKAPRKKLQ